MRAIFKVTSDELLTEQSIRTKLLNTKNMYVLKLLLNVLTVRIEALVLGNKFLYAMLKTSADLTNMFPPIKLVVTMH